jgi:hypothetical protein
LSVPDVVPKDEPNGPAVIDVAAGVATLVAVAAARGGRVIIRVGRPALGALLHPPFLGPGHQPIALVNALGQRGHTEMLRLARLANERANVVVPAVAGAMFDRIDITKLVIDKVDLNAVVATVDVDALADEMDLPGIIRHATEGVTSETVRSLRTQGIEADQAVARVVDRMLFRRRRPQPDVIDLVDAEEHVTRDPP